MVLMKEMQLAQTSLVSNKQIARDIFSMKLHAPEIAQKAVAGQFVMVYLDNLTLPRPISICDADSQTGIVELVYQVIGKGTRIMSEMEGRVENAVKILAPLGNGFDVKKELSRVAIVGGGIGVPPLFFLAKTLAERGVEFDVFFGFRSEPILVEKFQKITKGEIFIATEDGSVGHHGRVTEILQKQNIKYDEFFSCGPAPMLRALAEHAANTPCQVSMEERMACGLGTCVGCVVKVGEGYVRVCTEGPVFNASEVFV